MPDPSPGIAYVFGYASLVGMREPLLAEGVEHAPRLGRLRGYRRRWGAAMNNWEGGDAVKHFLDRETGERPHIRVAYLDIEPSEGKTVNGLAIPVDATRLAALDAREVNYSRLDVSSAFEPAVPQRVFAYIGTEEARERCRQGGADGNVVVSRDYATGVRQAFERLARGALAEFDRTTDPLPFAERDLRQVHPPS
jgi:hypothetical protein